MTTYDEDTAAMAAGLADEPEVLEPEVVEVDTARPMPDADEEPERGEVVHLPVRQEPVPDPRMGSLIPLQEELRGVAELAVTLAMADVVPKALRGKPADVLAVILTGRELGVAPMTAIRAFHVIEGQVTIAPKMRLAMVRQQGLGKVWPDEANDDEVATWYATRTDQPGVRFQSTYTMAMARSVETTIWKDGNKKRASLADKDNWRNYPARMLSWRCLGYLLDDAFSEVGTAIYQPDELGAITDEDGEAILDVESTEALVPAKSRTQSQAKPDPVANPATVARLKARCDKIAAIPAALAEMKRLWAAEGLPVLANLMHRHERDLSAIIDDVERRIQKGEFGAPDPAEEASQAAPSVPQDTPEPPAAPDTPLEAPGATQAPLEVTWDAAALPSERTAKTDQRWVAQAPPALIAECADTVKALATAAVLAALEEQDLPTTGNAANCAQRLTMRRIRLAMEAMGEPAQGEMLSEGTS